MAGFRRLPAIYRKTYLLTRLSQMTFSEVLETGGGIENDHIVLRFKPSLFIRRRRAATQAAPSGQKKIPSAFPTREFPPAFRRRRHSVPCRGSGGCACSIKKSATAWGTRNPEARFQLAPSFRRRLAFGQTP